MQAAAPELAAPDVRLFVAGVPTVDSAAAALRVAFEAYGRVTKVQHFAQRGFAFVTFSSAADAKLALAATSAESGHISSLFTDVKAAVNGKQKQQRSAKRADHTKAELAVWSGADDISLVLLAPSSHAARLAEYLTSGEWCNHSDEVRVLATTKATGLQCAEKVALLVQCPSDPSAAASALRHDSFLTIALNKALVLQPMSPLASLQQAIEAAASRLIAAAANEPEGTLRVRLSAFPPTLATFVAESLPAAFTQQVPDETDLKMVLSPANYSVMLSLIELQDGFRLGLEQSQSSTEEQSNSKCGVSSCGRQKMVSRAYYKLSEALGRYRLGVCQPADRIIDRLMDQHRLHGCKSAAAAAAEDADAMLIAVDCGAAPGGWSKLLAESGYCQTVYAIDPGNLELGLEDDADDNNSLLKACIVHMRCKAQDAISSFTTDGTVADIWVSDMCLQDMEEQHDIFKTAVDAQVVRRSTSDRKGALVVLTLKCTRGYSKASFDGQAAAQVERLQKILEDVQTIHLMTNRTGERTIIGFVR